MEKYLIQLFLPLYNNEGQRFPSESYAWIGTLLNECFGGLTIYQHMPVTGLWKEEAHHTVKDELIIYEVMADTLEVAFWKPLKEKLALLFQQESILIRSSTIYLI